MSGLKCSESVWWCFVHVTASDAKNNLDIRDYLSRFIPFIGAWEYLNYITLKINTMNINASETELYISYV